MEKNKHGKTVLGIALQEAYQVVGHWIIGNTNDSLLQMILDALRESKDFLCSTVQYIRAKRITEIDYINGCIW